MAESTNFQGVKTPDPYHGTVEEPAINRDAEASLKSGLQAAALASNNLMEHKTAAGGQGYDRESFASLAKAAGELSKTSYTHNPIFTGAEAPYTHDLTWRSLLVGAILGVIFGTQNVYFGIRSGVSFGGAITVSLLGYGIMRVLTKFISRALPFNAHENVILQTTAATGQSMVFTGGYSTYILAMSSDVAGPNKLAPGDTYDVAYWQGLLWLLSVICLGFFMAQPMRKQLIVKNDYPWPTPTATAVVIQSLHQAGAQDFAMKMLKFLLKVTGGSFLWYWFKWLFNAGGGMEAWPVFGPEAKAFNWTLDWSTAYIGSGVLMPWKSAWSMLLGTIVMFGIVSPSVWEYRKDWFPDAVDDKGSFEGLKSYWFLPALAITVVDSLYQIGKIVFDYVRTERKKKAAGAIGGSMTSATELSRRVEDPKTQVPTWLWAGGFAANTVLVCITTPLLFDVKWYQCLVCVLIGPVIGYGVNLGAALTDVGLVSALGKFILICFGGWAADITSALWLAGLGMAAVGSSNDLLGDYRTAYLLGTSPFAMFKAQVFGALFAAFFTPATYLLFLDAFTISTDGIFQAPGAVSLRALAVLFVDGLDILPKYVMAFVVAFAVWTIVNNLLNDFLPEKIARFLPNSIAFAVGGYVAPSYGINPVIGYGIKWIWMKSNPQAAEAFAPALGGGLIAGEGIAATTSAIFALAKVNAPKGMAIAFGAAAGGGGH